MFAVAFDLTVSEEEKHHPKGYPQAYAAIGALLNRHGFEWVQGSVYITKEEDMAKLFAAILALRFLPWFPTTVRDIRAFRLEQWSDFTPLLKQTL